VILAIVCICIPVGLGVLYGLARSGRWIPRSPIPPRHLPTELQRQELDRRAFQHRIRTRAILDSALHDIHRAVREHRDER